MPVPEERLYNQGKINAWFAVSSVLMTAAIFWMVWVDYDRPWHVHQDGYFVAKAALAHLDYLDAIRSDNTQKIDKARARALDQRELADKLHGTEIKELGEQIVEAKFNFKKTDDDWSPVSQILEVTRDTYEKALGEYGPEHPVTRKVHQQLLSEEKNVDALLKEKERWEDRKKELQRRLIELEKPMRAAEKRVADLEKIAEDALHTDQQYRGVLSDDGLIGGLPIVRAIINMPLLDFAAPKNTPGRYQVNQLVLPEIRQQLNYLESYTTDRCTTCHVAIGDPAFSMEQLAIKLEKSLLGINEQMQREGLETFSIPTPPILENVESVALSPGQVTKNWDELSKDQQKAYFDVLLELVNSYLVQTGRKKVDLGQPLLAHPNLELFVNIDSPHPMAKIGCTVCHQGNPQETDFVFAAHSPPTHEIEELWKEEYYNRRAGVPQITFDTMEHYWDRPMRLPQYTEAGCSKCHAQISDVDRFRGERVGARINRGRHLFTSVGCVNCHEMDNIPNARRVGPDLSHVAAKLKPAFVQQWAYFPQKFRPSTHMPHFFLQENNNEFDNSENKFDPDPVTRTQTEVAAITHYLFSVSQPWEPIKKPADITGNAERGRSLFKTVGCLACHANLAEFGQTWIADNIAHRTGIDIKKATLKAQAMTYEETTLYSMEHFEQEIDTFLGTTTDHSKQESTYKPPTFSRFAPDISGIGSKVSKEWLFSWLTDPSHYSAETNMPRLRLLPQEAADLASYLMTLKNDEFDQHEFDLNAKRLAMQDELVFVLLTSQRSERRSRSIMRDEGGELTGILTSLLTSSLSKQPAYDLISAMTLEEKKLMYLGSKSIGHYGCYACHLIPGFEETTPPGTNLTTWAQKPVAQLDFAFYDSAFKELRHKKEDIYGHVYPLHADTLNHWSPGENPEEQVSHTNAAFAKHKLLNPRIWDREKIKRPYDKLKMPNFYLSSDEVESLTTYLLSRVSPLVSDSQSIDYKSSLKGPIAKGRQLVRELNCLGCHQIEDNRPPIQQYYQRGPSDQLVLDEINSPPRLWGEGAKVQHHWLHGFILNVIPLRPWLQVRMPSFHITGDQATTLVQYFAALAKTNSNDLKKELAPIDEYIASAKAKSGKQKSDSDTEEPGSDWYTVDMLKERDNHLRRWTIERKLMRATEIDPLLTSEEDFKQAHVKMLDRARFFANLYDVSYPFVEPPRPESPEARYKLGERFFDDMGCLKCHVFGDMLPGPAKTTDDFAQIYRLDSVVGEGEEAVAILNGQPYKVGTKIDGFTLVAAEVIPYEDGNRDTQAYVEGPNQAGQVERIMLVAAKAPNLALTQQRLRREWVFRWMLNPGWIQPGTSMPQNFAGGKSPFAGAPEYPGTGEDHINLLVDYLYDAGLTNARWPLTKIVVEPDDGNFDESLDDEDFDD